MSAIWKYPLELQDRQIVQMPDGAELLHVADQDGVLCVWARVDEQRPPTDRIIYVRGTGHPVERKADGEIHRYVGSAQQGYFVWHVFDGWV